MPPVPVVPEGQSHVLAEFDCLDPLLSALRLDSGRLKCTCLAVSKKWLGLGTSAGGLHLIQREGWKQRLILTHKEGSIIQVACCPSDEDFIAVATSQGLVAVWELQLERRGRPERVSVSWEHRGQRVTALCWDSGSLRVFAGDQGGKVSFLRAGSTKLSKAATFVIFPVQTVTTVDSRVVQLGYQEGRLLVSSLSRCYLCDTEREKFWRIGNKERDGEYGACFFPQSRSPAGGPPPLLYCARPGSRIWESSFSGEVLSTHQFKQLLACPPLPLISYRSEPQYVPAQRSSQSIAFSKLLYLGDQHLLTWTDSAIYIFRPQSGQVLLWSEIKDVVDIAVHRSELFCLHGNGQMSHLSLVSAERCVERLLRRDSWVLAASVCCMFPHALVPSRTRKLVPIDRVEHLKTQLSPASHPELIRQLDEVISRLEPLDSASSSRRSSISSHESFNVLDCGIYRVISRRGSQSEEETGSFINQSASEEDRLKEFAFGPEEDQGEQGKHLAILGLISLRWKEIVSSLFKKTTEKINTLQMNTDLWQRSEAQPEVLVATSPSSEDMDHDKPARQERCQSSPVPAGGGPAGGETAGGETAGGGPAGGETVGGGPAGGGEPVRPEPVRVQPPTALPSDLLGDLTPLATLYLEMSCFRGQGEEPGVLSAAGFLRRYFFLLDAERPTLSPSASTELTRSSKVVEVIQKGDLLKSLRGLRELQPWSAPELLAHTHRLYERHGEAAVRSFSQFHPAVTPADVALMAQPPHFLAYLDNLVQSHAEELRLSFLGSLLQSESLRQDWLELGLSHDAPQPSDTLTADGQPRWHSHFFSWGYGRLLSLLIQLPADLSSKETMAETCRSRGYWTGFLYLCCELQRRTEAFSTICRLDDMSLLEDPQVVPQTVQEWKVLIQLSQQCSTEPEPGRRRQVTPENLTLRLAQSVGPDRALEVLEECGLPLALSPHSALVCELLRVAEKRQRATIQTMLERCDRFLWSQHA
uniref:Hermansky-Pudlak syndrome 5 protein homolog n=1 Tax=Gadus morhua TaxID=8049 RepID=A0A8C4ZYK8_GADMO